MVVDGSARTAAEPVTIPLRRVLPGLIRDPIATLTDAANRADGAVVQLRLGPFRPYLISHPAHAQYVLRERPENFVRDGGDGLFWKPLRRLLGDGILSDGHAWESARTQLNPLFTAKRIDTLGAEMAGIINRGLDDLGQYARSGAAIDAADELSKVVYQTIIRIFFGDRVTAEECARLVPALDTIATSIGPRLLMPFVPYWVPMPGDRAFRRCTKIIDDTLYPVIRRSREQPGDGDDIISVLCRSRNADGREFDEKQVRDNVVSMFGAATETTAVALVWLWPLLERHPEVAERLYEEVDRVVGADPVGPQHLPDLTYTRMIMDEMLRLYPSGWMLPRAVVEADTVGGVRLAAGDTVVVSPYVTQRLESFWDRPGEFDPERFAEGAPKPKHRYAYFPFGGGPHQCLGRYVYFLEAPFIIAGMVSRFRTRMVDPEMPQPQAAASLRPRQRVRMTLEPVTRRSAV